MTDVATSLIIVSRHRPEALQRAICAVLQGDHSLYELIIVADPAACMAVRQRFQGLKAKIVPFDLPNISLARNAGLEQAAGVVVAFMDDDAVPEPNWLRRLTQPFANPQVVAATGFVRGRNGFAFQWRAMQIDCWGRDHPLEVPDGVSLWPSSPRMAIKTQGTNCAFRRETLLRIGGFDPAYPFYLDEADVNMRMAGMGLTAVVPNAQVHHGFGASSRRRGDRAPVSLEEIAASFMVFLRRHAYNENLAHNENWDAPVAAFYREQRRRLIGFMLEGKIEPRDVDRLMATFQAGISKGRGCFLPDMQPMMVDKNIFMPIPYGKVRDCHIVSGRIWQRRSLQKRAKQGVLQEKITMLFEFSPTIWRHYMQFHPDGYWYQKGGLFGASGRDEGFFKWWLFSKRVQKEWEYWAKLRAIL